MKKLIKAHLFFFRNSKSYVGQETYGKYWITAYIRFMYLVIKDTNL